MTTKSDYEAIRVMAKNGAPLPPNLLAIAKMPPQIGEEAAAKAVSQLHRSAPPPAAQSDFRKLWCDCTARVNAKRKTQA